MPEYETFQLNLRPSELTVPENVPFPFRTLAGTGHCLFLGVTTCFGVMAALSLKLFAAFDRPAIEPAGAARATALSPAAITRVFMYGSSSSAAGSLRPESFVAASATRRIGGDGRPGRRASHPP